MRTDVSLKTRIEDQCKLAGFDTDYLYKHGKKVLKIVHDACRNTVLDADDLVEDLCSDSYETDEFRKLSEAVVRLEFFETNYMKDKYEASILREAVRMCEKRPKGGYPYIKDGHPENESVVIQYLSSEAIFYSIEDVMELTGWSKRVVQNLFNKRGFPSTNLGKRKLVESHALIAYFSEKRLREDESCWE